MTRFIRFKRSFENIRFEEPLLSLTGNAFLPSVALIPLLQHTGTAATAVVSSGDRVKEGQLIARGNGPDSAHIHASIPGIIREFRTVSLPDGQNSPAAVIQLAGSFDILGRKEANFPWQNIPESEILRVLEEKGVINTFEKPVPLCSRLRVARKNGSPTLVLRLFDLDPTCQLDSFLSHHTLDTILDGAALLSKALDAPAVYLVHDEKQWYGPTVKQLEEIFKRRKVQIIKSDKRYPSGNTPQITKMIPGKNLVLIDPVTAISAFEAVVRNQPVLNRLIAISGPALDSPAILKVRIGTPIGDIIEECGGFKSDPGRIVVNGLLTGHAVFDLDTPVTKYTKSLHIMDTDTCPGYTVRECIHCGRCLQVCPVSIDPIRVVNGIRKEQFTDKLQTSIDTCQNCGCCAMVCPSRIPLHQIIREAATRQQGDTK